MHRLTILAAGSALLLGLGRAVAGCAFTELSSPGFGSIDGAPVAGEPRQVASVSVSCDSEYRLGLDAGSSPSGSRRLGDGNGNFVSYQLWQDGAATLEWGDSGLAIPTYPAPSLYAVGSGTPVTYAVTGTLSAAAEIPAGLYTDTVQVTLAYPPYGPADQQTADIHLALNVTGTCSVDVSGVHGFGLWPAGAAPTGVALGAVNVTCPTGLAYAVGLDAGLNYEGSRRMSDGAGAYIPYLLRLGAGNGPEWGDRGLSAIESGYLETHPAQAAFGAGIGSAQPFFIWGDAHIGAVPAGSYNDSVSVTVVW
ncbi:MAG TPA: spore coat protein U domain-containing protein [Gammaproteobacteria bacterium]